MWHLIQTEQHGLTATSELVPAAKGEGSLAIDAVKRSTALVVDDHAATCRMHQLVLRHCGLDARTAHDGLEAITMTLNAHERGEVIALILMDLDMPTLDGWAATASLRAAGFKGAVVAISGNAEADVGARCRRSGFDAFIAKPASVNHLVSVVTALLACHRLDRVA